MADERIKRNAKDQIVRQSGNMPTTDAQKKAFGNNPPLAKKEMMRQKNGNVGARMNIKDQTLSQRRSVKESKKINPDFPEIQRSAKRAQGYKIKRKKKPISRAAVVLGAIFLLMLLVISSVIGIVFYANLVKTSTKEYGNIKLKLGSAHMNDELKAVRVDNDLYIRNGELYLNLTLIADKFGFVVTGDHKELRFIADPDTGENICVWLNTPFVEVNGTRIRLNGDITKNEESVFIPAEFFYEYVDGVEINFDEETSVLSVLRSTEISGSGKLVEKDISFKLKNARPSVGLVEKDLTAEEELKTYFDPNEIISASGQNPNT